MRKNNNRKQGISLIVLVITIIVMIILAAAIVITLANNGIIGKANEAKEGMTEAQIREAAQLAWADIYLSGEKITDWEDAIKDYLEADGISRAELDKYTIIADEHGFQDVELSSSEHGLYYDEAYVIDIVEEGTPMTLAYVFHIDGSIEVYAPIVNGEITTELYVLQSGPKGSFTYENENNQIIYGDVTATVSKDGKTIEMDGDVATLQAGLEHGPYRGYTYQSDADSEGIIYSVTLNNDGTGTSVAKLGEQVVASQTATIVFEDDEHKMTAAEGNIMGTFLVSLDGKTVYWKESKMSFAIVGEPERQEKEEILVVHSGTIPEGATYYVGVKESGRGDYSTATATLTAGQPFPSKPSTGDVYVYGDYEYRYNMGFVVIFWLGQTSNVGQYTGWGVVPINTGKASYEPLLTEINNEAIKTMSYTFNGCSNLTEAPEIPDTVVNMQNAFEGCSNLITYVDSTEENGKFTNYIIPASVTNMQSTFQNCTSITTSPNWSNAIAVENMASVCKNCTSLVEVADIPSGAKKLTSAFEGCTSLIIAPNLSKATKLDTLENAFVGCTALTTASTIPSSVTNIQLMFEGCKNLTGTVTINTTPQKYTGAFTNTVKPIKIAGTCSNTVKQELAYASNVTY